MRWTSLTLLGGLAATASTRTDADGPVTDLIKPQAAAPEGCQTSYNGKFQIQVEPMADTKAPQKRDAAGPGTLVMELKDSVLTDAKHWTGYIASNYQFQFDGPPQAGAIYTGGFCVFNNGSLVLGASSVFYRCKSGDFYNLYDRHWAPQCEPILIRVVSAGDGAGQGQTGGQNVVGTKTVATTVLTVLDDGQPQVIQTQVPVPICQIGDGQIQAHTTPCAQAPSLALAPKPVSQINDGQPQAPSLAPAINPVYQINDGQPQAHPAPAVAPAPQSPAAAPNVQSLPAPSKTPTSRIETSIKATSVVSQASSSFSANATATAGAGMVRPGPAASLIIAVVGLFFCLY